MHHTRPAPSAPVHPDHDIEPDRVIHLEAVNPRAAWKLDVEFDRNYPAEIRKKSNLYWTPVSVARRAVELLQPDASMRILDVGSGAGKFCLVGAAQSPAAFVGVESQVELVDVARTAARALGAVNASFVVGDALALDWSSYDALYFYNPFQELSWRGDTESERERAYDDFQRHVAAAKRKLEAMPTGSRVVTYYGYGAEMPRGYSCSASERSGPGDLELWVKG